MSVRIRKVDVDGMQCAMGIDQQTPVFHYIAEAEKNEQRILAYRLRVSAGEDIYWDSGKCSSDGTPYIRYQGKALAPKTQYCVALQLWDEQDIPSAWYEADAFETGFLGEKWEARWIEPQQEDAIEEKELSFMEMIIPNPEFWGGETRLRPCQRIRKEVNCDKPIRCARLYATAHGVYQLYVNGKQISERRLAPENSAYEKMLYYQTYDLTEVLQCGENVLGFLLGDGWWIGRLGMAGDSCNYGNRLGVIFQLEIAYEDGNRITYISDGSEQCHSAHIRYSDLYIGEKQDLTMQDDAWLLPGSTTAEWARCNVADYPTEHLRGQMTDPVKVTQVLETKEYLHTPKGELVLDFGQVMAGGCRLEIEASEGTIVTLEHGEVLDRDGNYINNILGRNKDQKDVFICREGKQILEPQFTYHGFRYVRVTGITREQILQSKALVMGTPIEKTGYFHCSDERLNQLQHNIEWSTISNMFSVPTDCPQREKLGWTGDIQVYTKTGAFNYDLRNFLSAWLHNVALEQCEDGEIPVVVPNAPKQERTQRVMSGGSNSSAAWGDACVLVPYYLYECYGERGILETNFSMMEKWLSYIAENCKLKPEGYAGFSEARKKRNSYLWTKQYHFGDWLIPSLRALPNGVQRGTEETAAVVGSCYYAITVECFIKVCETLGKEAKAKEYRSLLGNIRNAVREEFVEEDGTVGGSSLQGLYVIVLKAGVTDGVQKERVVERLVRLIEENGYCLDTGFASVPYLLDVLYENGRADIAYRLLFQTKAPSWLYMVNNGATTIWENWLAVLENGVPTESSYNHYAFGCVGDFIYRHIGGIARDAAGYRKILFAPDFSCGLTECSCEEMTPYGRCALHWKLTNQSYEVEGEVPLGCQAVLRIGTKEKLFGSGKFRMQGEREHD